MSNPPGLPTDWNAHPTGKKVQGTSNCNRANFNVRGSEIVKSQQRWLLPWHVVDRVSLSWGSSPEVAIGHSCRERESGTQEHARCGSNWEARQLTPPKPSCAPSGNGIFSISSFPFSPFFPLVIIFPVLEIHTVLLSLFF
jgi:hypothetical protein